MIETVIVLLFFVHDKLVEHRIQDSISECLKHKREAERHLANDNKQLMCGEVEAEIVKNADGTLTIGNIINK